MNETLTINYEVFEEECKASLTISKNDVAVFMFTGEDAKFVHEMLLTGNIGEFVRKWITK